MSRVRAMWIDGDALSAADMNLLDQRMTDAWDGDSGGTIVPAPRIVVGGAGVVLAGEQDIVASGDCFFDSMAFEQTVPLTTGWSRTISTPLWGVCQSPQTWRYTATGTTPQTYGQAASNPGMAAATKLRVHNGARLNTVKVRWRSGIHPRAITAALSDDMIAWPPGTERVVTVFDGTGLPEQFASLDIGGETVNMRARVGNRLFVIRAAPYSVHAELTRVTFGTYTVASPLFSLLESNASGDVSVVKQAAGVMSPGDPDRTYYETTFSVGETVDARTNTYWLHVLPGSSFEPEFWSAELSFSQIDSYSHA